MKNFFKTNRSFLFIRNIWTQIFIVIIFLMFISHLLAFFIYSRYSESAQLQINRGIIARQIVTIIEAVEINPPDKQAYVVNAIDMPNFAVSFDKSPKYKMIVTDMDILDILAKLKEIPESSDDMNISVKFGDRLWLNISATIQQSPLDYHIVLLGYESVIMLVLILMVWSINRYNKPLRRFIESVEKMGSYLGPMQLPEDDGPPMVREAAKAVNHMQEKIKTLVKDRTQMLAAISHDLRTPITRLKLRAQFIEDVDQQQKFLKDLGEMEKMINEGLSFFRDEQQVYEKSKIDLVSLLMSLSIDYQETGGKVSFHGPKEQLPLKANALALKRAFTNLIDNALKYGQSAKINLAKKDGQYIVTIEDKGPGIAPADMERVFSPYYRGDQSRNKLTTGVGLGLTVARNIILMHQGEIELQNLPGSGLKVIVKFLTENS